MLNESKPPTARIQSAGMAVAIMQAQLMQAQAQPLYLILV
jgi:hypothetical protein